MSEHPKEVTGFSLSRIICLSHTNLMECNISKANWRSEQGQNTCIGKCWHVSPERYVLLQSRIPLERAYMRNCPEAVLLPITCGKKKQESMERNLSWGTNHFEEMKSGIGKPFGTPPNKETLMKSQPPSVCRLTHKSNELKKTICDPSPLRELSKCFGEKLALASLRRRGTKQDLKHTPKIHVQNSGTGIRDKKTWSSMNSEGKSESATCYVGSTDTQSASKRKDPDVYCALETSGLLVTSIPECGTRILMKKQKLL